MDIREILARNVRLLRHSRGWTQEAFADAAQIDRSHVSAVETAKYYQRTDLIEKMAAAFGVEPHALLDPDTATLLNIPEGQKRVSRSRATAAARRPVRHVKQPPAEKS